MTYSPNRHLTVGGKKQKPLKEKPKVETQKIANDNNDVLNQRIKFYKQKCERLENELFEWESVKAQQIAIKAKL